MNLEIKISRNPETAYRNIDGEGLVMNPADSMLHSMNDVACAIWEFIEQPRTIGDVVDMVTNIFECDRITAEVDVSEFLEKLQKQHLVKLLE